jgi:hypothetical protein
MTLTDPNGGGVYGHAAPSTVTLCPGSSYAGLFTARDTGSRLTRWIDSWAICAPAAIGSDGSTGYGNAGQSIMQGPGQFNTDFSVGKTFRTGGLREDAVLAFRTEFYSALNHPQFANPGTFGDGQLRGDHAKLGGAAADSVRGEVSVLKRGGSGQR